MMYDYCLTRSLAIANRTRSATQKRIIIVNELVTYLVSYFVNYNCMILCHLSRTDGL